MRFGQPTSLLSGRFDSISDDRAVPFRVTATARALAEEVVRTRTAKEEATEVLCF